MVGIDIADTIVVRRVTEKGTKIVKEKLHTQNWAGKSFKEYERKKRDLAGNRGLASSKGTKVVRLNQMIETAIPDTSGLMISSGRGTSLRMA
jgi:hypothetical protein